MSVVTNLDTPGPLVSTLLNLGIINICDVSPCIIQAILSTVTVRPNGWGTGCHSPTAHLSHPMMRSHGATFPSLSVAMLSDSWGPAGLCVTHEMPASSVTPAMPCLSRHLLRYTCTQSQIQVSLSLWNIYKNTFLWTTNYFQFNSMI